SPASAARGDHFLSGDKITHDRAYYRADKQADDSKKQRGERAQNCAEHPPFRSAEIFCAEISAQKIERIGGERKQNKNCNTTPTDAFLRADHHSMDNRGRENDGRSGNDR